MIHADYYRLAKKQKRLLQRKNKIDHTFYNGIYQRYLYPVLTNDHVPLHWRYDLSMTENPYLIERLGINSVFNPGAIFHEGSYYLMARVEGTDRKSFFAIAKSTTGIDRFEFIDQPVLWDKALADEVNMYDIRLVKHQDGAIYGTYCSEAEDTTNSSKSASAIARTALVRTYDLKHWEMIGLIKTKANQQRNMVLHPEFVQGKYAFYTRPQDGFIETGSGGGIGLGLCDDINHPVIEQETILSPKRYHTVYEAKNGQGPAPIKTDKGWIHIAHGVRETAAGYRYVLYAFATSLTDPFKVISSPSGYFLAPLKDERVGDVSNVVFSNGAIVNESQEVFVYYAGSDSRTYVATTNLSILQDYVFNSPQEMFTSTDCIKQRIALIEKNKSLLKG
ncbi:MAG: glycosidase [Candidatus Izemoplasmatales bacterium]